MNPAHEKKRVTYNRVCRIEKKGLRFKVETSVP